MNSKEHPCPDCRYPRRIDEEFCPTCPFGKLEVEQPKTRWSSLFDFGGGEKKPETPHENPFPQLQSQPSPQSYEPPKPEYQQPVQNPSPQPQSPIPATLNFPQAPQNQGVRSTLGTAEPPIAPPPMPKNQSRGTFNPYTQPLRPNPKFKLTSVPRHTETSSNTVEFEGESVGLNRNNLDRENFTISGQEHATIENVDGRWFISNKSSLKTTYIQVNAMMEIKEGEVILLGDRMFIFRPE